MRKKVIVVGGVAGGATATARLRRVDEKAQIIMIEKGPYISFANCGLPYYVGGTIEDRSDLLVQTPMAMMSKFNVDVRTMHEVINIDRQNKKLIIKDLEQGRTYEETYDQLILSTGSTPVVPPIPGIDTEGIFTLWTVPDVDKIKQYLQAKRVKRALVVGGGFIGIEMAENLHDLGVDVTLVEMQDQVMSTIDPELAHQLHHHLLEKGVNLALGKGVTSFERKNDAIQVQLGEESLQADMVILSIGVKPQSKIAKDAGLEVSKSGHILVDDYLKTSDEAISALGDVIAVQDFVTGELTAIPLAGPANKQGRIVANNVLGKGGDTYKGTQGTSIAKVFDLTVASTGQNEKQLKKRGLVHRKDYHKVLIHGKDHVSYYPGSSPMTIKVLFDKSGKILGSQIVGKKGVDKRIDVIATAMRFGAKVDQLKELELAYAPPFNGAKDPVNMLGFVALNLQEGLTNPIFSDEVDDYLANGWHLVDVRSQEELEDAGYIKGALHIPLHQLRNRLGELDKDKAYIIYCGIGIRGYIAERILKESGFNQVANLAGGYDTYSLSYCMKSPVACSGYYHRNMDFSDTGSMNHSK